MRRLVPGTVSALALAGALTVALPVPALAGGYPVDPGQVRLIVTQLHSASVTGFDPNGDIFNRPAYIKDEDYAFFDWGVTSRLTLSLTPSYSHVIDRGSGTTTSGLGYTELAARYAVLRGDGWILSGFVSARVPGIKLIGRQSQTNTQDREYDARLLLFHSFTLGRMNGYFDISAGDRTRQHAPDETHVDLSIGLRPSPRVLITLQDFTTLSQGAGQPGYLANHYSNVWLTGGYDLNRRLMLKAGVIATISGVNALRERGFTTGLQYAF